jgi:AraC-like DNA-binding protein
VSNVEWLLRESTDATLLRITNVNQFDDERWRGTVERIWVGPGLHLTLTDVLIHAAMSVEAWTERTDSFLYSQVTLTGAADIDFLDGRRTVTSVDRAFILRPKNAGSRFTFKDGERFLASGFDLDLDRIARLFDGEVPAVLTPLMAPEVETSQLLSIRTSSLVRAIGASLFAPTLHGALRTLMQEGAVLQLLALMIAASSNIPPPPGTDALPRRERDALEEARERLLANIATPPSLGELALAVGMTEKRLNAGFRALFGATVYETLRNERLEHARIVLESGEASVKEIAYRVGYNHVSNFVSAFKARYGTSPGRYLTTQGVPETNRKPDA